jgi:two-component system, OmpR family, sensor kinase
VSDTGPGIPADELEAVFDRYTRAADSGGSGLGLAIARSLVEAHGGAISAERRDEGGTTVRVRLPAVDH